MYQGNYIGEDSQVTSSEIMRSVAFTGYRPQKLPFGNNLNDPMAIKLRAAMYAEYEKLVLKGFTFFLTGGAIGSDLMAAEVILELRKKYGKRKVVHQLCLPCLNHCEKWGKEDKERLERIKEDSTVYYVSHSPYFNGCMQKRNKYMVDTSAVLFAVYDGQPGGTKNTVDYARKMERKILMLRPNALIRMEFFESIQDVEQLSLLDD